MGRLSGRSLQVGVQSRSSAGHGFRRRLGERGHRPRSDLRNHDAGGKAAEIAAFGKLDKEFKARDAQLLGVSTDSEYVHHAWRSTKEELKNLPFPMLSDIKRELSTELGILDEAAGVAQRATYVVDPEGVIRFVYVTDLSVGRSPEEVLRVLDALQTDELCPCNWKKGEDTLKAA